MEHALHPAVAALLAERRLVADDGPGALHSFTVARTAALLELRANPRSHAWQWTLALVRAANALSPVAGAIVSSSEDEAGPRTEMKFHAPRLRGPKIELEDLELRGFLQHALDDDAAREGDALAEAKRRFCVLAAAAINAGLAEEPRAIELITPAGGRVWERRETVARGQDPYRGRALAERAEPERFVVRVYGQRPSFGRRLAEWLRLRGTEARRILELWTRAIVTTDEPVAAKPDEITSLAPRLGAPVALGDGARWWAHPPVRGPWLIRDGVSLLDLGPALRAVGQSPTALAGFLDGPGLRLTADGADVVRDASFDLLLAWLLGALARARDGGATTSTLTHVSTASGRAVPIELIAQRARLGKDLLYVWPHQSEDVPKDMKARVFRLWPGELARLGELVPGLQAVPLSALGGSQQLARVDLEHLERGSLPAVSLTPEGGSAARLGGEPVTLALSAYVHRAPSARQGLIALLALGRRIATIRDPARVIAGVTLICEVRDAAGRELRLALDRLRADDAGVDDVARRCHAAGLAALDGLLTRAFTHEDPWELPVVRARADALDGVALGLHYAGQGERLALAWRPSPLLELEVATARFRGQGGRILPRTLGEALDHARSFGGLVVATGHSAKWALERLEIGDEPWVLSIEARALVERILGDALLWTPDDAARALRPATRGDQRSLLLSREAIAALDIEPLGARARQLLRAHLLVAQTLGEETHGLERRSLFRRYDPRALRPVRYVSLETVLAERPRLVPRGAVARGLSGLVLELDPGEARAAARLYGLAPAPPLDAGEAEGKPLSRGRERGSGKEPVRRRGRGVALLRVPIADELAVGALRIEPDSEDRESAPARRISLWSSGLHIDDLGLPAPLDVVGGRLWLTPRGVREMSRLADRVNAVARELVRQALDARALLPPGSRERAWVSDFLARATAAADDPKATLYRDLLPTRARADASERALAARARARPLRRLPEESDERVRDLLHQSLGAAVSVEAAALSWSVLRSLEGGGRNDWRFTVGARNRRVQAALSTEPRADGEDPRYVLGAMLLAAWLYQARAKGPWRPLHGVALYRLLALVYAHADAPAR